MTDSDISTFLSKHSKLSPRQLYREIKKSKTLFFSISSVQLLNRVWLFVTSWIAARHASLSITNSWSLLKLVIFFFLIYYNLKV